MWWLTGRAIIGLLIFDLLGFGRNFPKMHHCVSGWKVASAVAWPDAVDRVCDAVNHACVVYPKQVMCLQRSAVTTCLLRSCGVPAQMVLGAQKIPFKAHAWTEVKGHAINELKDVQNYGVWERC